MRCPLCKSTKCILTDNDFDYRCLNCNHEGYWGREELDGRTPVKNQEEEDNSFHVSKAEAYVIQDENLFPRNGKETIYLEEVRKVVEKLRSTEYFGDADESFFVDDELAPPRGTEEYRQWYEHCMAKGWYNIIGESPSPDELEDENENDEPHVSVYACTVMAKKGDCFYNAPGTSDSLVEIDGAEYIPIEAWEEATGKDRPTVCPNFFCKAETKNDKQILGAHVLIDYQEEDISDGQICYIIPLCKSCNSSKINKDIMLKRDIPIIELEW